MNSTKHTNSDRKTVQGFGDEWSRFDQTGLPEGEKSVLFSEYFGIFPWEKIDEKSAVGADFGCGSGRWASLVAPRAKKLIVLDASPDALSVCRKNLAGQSNVEFLNETIDDCSLPEASLDFAYSLGVLHHIPNIESGLASISKRLKPGAPFLVYLYYALDNRPAFYRWIWRGSNLVRRFISRLPFGFRKYVCEFTAATVYFPLARTAKLLEMCGILPRSWPLAYYRHRSFYTMRTDALDRFGTRLENRYTRDEIRGLLENAGFREIVFSEAPPFWCAVGYRA